MEILRLVLVEVLVKELVVEAVQVEEATQVVVVVVVVD